MTSLSSQLRRLQNQSGAHTAHTERLSTAAGSGSARRVPSLIFSQHDARQITREQLHELAIVGLRTLVSLDPRLHRAAAFLFSDAHIRKERSMFTSAESSGVVAPAVDELLALLAPHVMVPATLQVLEYLVRVFEIHEYEAAALLRLVLPAHDQGLFVRVLHITHLDGTGFEFLRENKAAGTVLPRATLVTAARENPKVLGVVCDIVAQALRRGVDHPAGVALFAFVASSLATSSSGGGGGNGEGSEGSFRVLLPFLVQWLPASAASASSSAASASAVDSAMRWELSAAARLVFVVWATESRFSADIVRVIFASVCRLIRSLEGAAARGEDDAKQERITAAIRDSYRLLAHICNTQRSLLLAAAAASASASDSDAAAAPLVPSLAQQLVSLPFSAQGLGAFARASPWALHRLVLKHCFDNSGGALAASSAAESDDDDDDDAAGGRSATSGDFYRRYLERCFSLLPLSAAHVHQSLLELARTAAAASSTPSSSTTTSTTQPLSADIHGFVARSMSVLDRRFGAHVDIALADLLRASASSQSSSSSSPRGGSDIMQDFVLRFCSGSKYDLVDLSAASGVAGGGALAVPLIGALVHPVAEVRRMAAGRLRGSSGDGKDAAAATHATFLELQPLLLHILAVETEPAVLLQVVHAVVAHHQRSAVLQQEEGADAAEQQQQQTEALVFECYRAVMKAAPPCTGGKNGGAGSAAAEDSVSTFIALLRALGGLFHRREAASSSSPAARTVALCARIFLQALQQQQPASAAWMPRAVAALGLEQQGDDDSLVTERGWASPAALRALDCGGDRSAWAASAVAAWAQYIPATVVAGGGRKLFKSASDLVEGIGASGKHANAMLADAVAAQVAIGSLLLAAAGEERVGDRVAACSVAIGNTLALCRQLEQHRGKHAGAARSGKQQQQQQQQAAVASAVERTAHFVALVSRLLVAPVCAAVVKRISRPPAAAGGDDAVALAGIPIAAVSSSAALAGELLPSLLHIAGPSHWVAAATLLAAAVANSAAAGIAHAARAAASLFSAVAAAAADTAPSNGAGKKSAKNSNSNSSSSSSSYALLGVVCTALMSSLAELQQQHSAGDSAHESHAALSAALQALAATFASPAIRDAAAAAATLCSAKCGELAVLLNSTKAPAATTAPLWAVEPALFAATIQQLLADLFSRAAGSAPALAFTSPALFHAAARLVASWCGSSGGAAVWATRAAATQLAAADTFATVLDASALRATPLPLEALALFARALLSAGGDFAPAAVQTLVADRFLGHDAAIRVAGEQSGAAQPSAAADTFRFVFPAQLVVDVVPVLARGEQQSSGLLQRMCSRMLRLYSRGCAGVTAALSRSPQLFDTLVRGSLTQQHAEETTAAECVRLVLQESSAIRAELQVSPDHAQRLVASVLHAARFCIGRAACADDDSAEAAAAAAGAQQRHRVTFLETAAAALQFIHEYCGSRIVVAAADRPSLFFLEQQQQQQDGGAALLLQNWHALLLQRTSEAGVAPAALRLVEAAVTLAVGTRELSRAALNLLARVVLGSFAAPAGGDGAVLRMSPTVMIQRLVKILLPALMQRTLSADGDQSAPFAVVAEAPAAGNNDDDDDDDDDDAPPMIFTRGGKQAPSKYTAASKAANGKQKQQQQRFEDPEQARAAAEQRRQRVAAAFERAKQSLSVPIVALLVRMREVATAAQLQFRAPDALLADIVCSFDILDQMACFRGLLELWHEVLLHPQGRLPPPARRRGGAGDEDGDDDAEVEVEEDVLRELRATDMRPHIGHVASFLRAWSEDQRFIDAFVRANTAAVLTLTSSGGNNGNLSRRSPALAPFCDAVFSALSLFQFYKLAVRAEGVAQQEQQERGDDAPAAVVGALLATLLSMVDEELFVVCIREIVLNRVSPRLTASAGAAPGDEAKLRVKSITAARRVGLEILCDRLALSTTLGGSSSRYTNKRERIARGATSVLSARCSQRLFELLHRLLRDLVLETELAPHAAAATTDAAAAAQITLQHAGAVFARCASAATAAKSTTTTTTATDVSAAAAAQGQQRRQREKGAAAAVEGGAGDSTGRDAKRPNAAHGAAARAAEQANEAGREDGDDEAYSIANADGPTASFRGLLRRRALAVPAQHVLDVQWTAMCCEESARCFGDARGDQLALTVGTLARIGLDALCLRGAVHPTVPVYRGVAHVKSCAWGDSNSNSNDAVEAETSSASAQRPVLFQAEQIVLLCSVVTAVSGIAAALGSSRMVSAAGGDALNLLTTALRYSAWLSHRADAAAVAVSPEVLEALRQLRHCALEGLRRALPATWTLVEPFLAHIISAVTARSMAEDPGTSAAARELLAEVDGLLEPRVLFPCIAEALQQSDPATHSFALLFQVVQNLVGRLSKADVKAIPSLMGGSLFTVAFDKFAAGPQPLPPVDTLRAAFGAFASCAVKFRETTCAALCSNIVVWATTTASNSSTTTSKSSAAVTGAARLLEIRRWTICLALFEYIFERLGAVAEFAFAIASPVIVDALTSLASAASLAAAAGSAAASRGRASAAQSNSSSSSVNALLPSARSCLEMAFACARRIADIANEAAEELTNTATDSADTPEALLPYFARPAPFEALCAPLCAQLANVGVLVDSSLEESLLPALRAVFKSLRSPRLWSKMQQALLRNLRQPAAASRLATLALLRQIYADGGDTLASLVLSEALPSIVEATEDDAAEVAEEARVLCKELSAITSQNILEYMQS